MTILKIILAIIVIAFVIGVIAFVMELFKKSNNHKPNGPYERFVKRFLDAFLSAGTLIVLSPMLVILIVVGAVKMRGNPFFTQERPGLYEKIFKLIKFRSMNSAKDENGVLLPDVQRITGYGHFIRNTSLDELPELINILKGDMSIVGPRPLLVKYLDRYSIEQHHRHDVRPGLTGYAQVHGRNCQTWEERFKMDVEYTQHVTFAGDVKIILDTIRTVLKHEGINSDKTSKYTVSEFEGNK